MPHIFSCIGKYGETEIWTDCKKKNMDKILDTRTREFSADSCRQKGKSCGQTVARQGYKRPECILCTTG